jgi:hypothetical protein
MPARKPFGCSKNDWPRGWQTLRGQRKQGLREMLRRGGAFSDFGLRYVP